MGQWLAGPVAKGGGVKRMQRVLTSAALASLATPVLAGFNEGDSFGPSGLEVLVLGAFGLIALPFGAVLTFAGLDALFRATLVVCGVLLLALVAIAVVLAGQFALVVVLLAAIVLVPAAVSFFVGGLLGRAARRWRVSATT